MRVRVCVWGGSRENRSITVKPPIKDMYFKRGQTSQQRTHQVYSSTHTLYKITCERGQPLYKGQTGVPMVSSIRRFHCRNLACIACSHLCTCHALRPSTIHMCAQIMCADEQNPSSHGLCHQVKDGGQRRLTCEGWWAEKAHL